MLVAATHLPSTSCNARRCTLKWPPPPAVRQRMTCTAEASAKTNVEVLAASHRGLHERAHHVVQGFHNNTVKKATDLYDVLLRGIGDQHFTCSTLTLGRQVANQISISNMGNTPCCRPDRLARSCHSGLLPRLRRRYPSATMARQRGGRLQHRTRAQRRPRPLPAACECGKVYVQHAHVSFIHVSVQLICAPCTQVHTLITCVVPCSIIHSSFASPPQTGVGCAQQ